MANSKEGEKVGGAGRQREYIKEEERRGRSEKRGSREHAGCQSPSHATSHRVRRKEMYIE